MSLVHDAPIRLLGLSGSLRRASTNTAVLRTLKDILRGRAALDIHPLDDIALFNGDLDSPDLLPAPVSRLKAAITDCDGIVICSPEYNHGIPGVLKNALDWASRPAFNSPLKDKAILIMTASAAPTGGVRAQYQIRETLASTLSRVVIRREVVIGGIPQKITDGRLTDEMTMQFILEAVDGLLLEIAGQRNIRVPEAKARAFSD